MLDLDAGRVEAGGRKFRSFLKSVYVHIVFTAEQPRGAIAAAYEPVTRGVQLLLRPPLPSALRLQLVTCAVMWQRFEREGLRDLGHNCEAVVLGAAAAGRRL